MIYLGKRKPQKIKRSYTMTLPMMWIRQFSPEQLKDVEVFVNENLDLIIRMSVVKQKEEISV
jgi:hypothetical protein